MVPWLAEYKESQSWLLLLGSLIPPNSKGRSKGGGQETIFHPTQLFSGVGLEQQH